MTNQENKSFWTKLGKNVAKGTKATGQGTVFGLCWTAKKMTQGAKATGKAFKEEWDKA